MGEKAGEETPVIIEHARTTTQETKTVPREGVGKVLFLFAGAKRKVILALNCGRRPASVSRR